MIGALARVLLPHIFTYTLLSIYQRIVVQDSQSILPYVTVENVLFQKRSEERKILTILKFYFFLSLI